MAGAMAGLAATGDGLVTTWAETGTAVVPASAMAGGTGRIGMLSIVAGTGSAGLPTPGVATDSELDQPYAVAVAIGSPASTWVSASVWLLTSFGWLAPSCWSSYNALS